MGHPSDYGAIRNHKGSIKYSLLPPIERLKFTPSPKGYPIKLPAWKRRYEDPMNPSERIDQLIAELTDWRGKTLASIRKSILEADR